MPRAATDRPNIILINCDDLGYGDLGCYGSTVNATPTLDRMAAEGVRFTDFYMASSVCSPSRGAMMTGCYPPRIGFGEFGERWVLYPGQDVGLHPSEKTIATLLKDQGYATTLVGKWHCGDQPEFLPTNHGFDHYYGIPFSNDMGRQRNRLDKFPPLPLMRDTEVIQEQPDQVSLIERYVEESTRFIRANQDRPFFLYLAHMHVHLPIYAPENFMRASTNGRYGAAVACIDWAASVIFDEIKRAGLDENTLIIFTSDNGSRAQGEGGSNGPLRGSKGTTWEGGMRLPCIMRWPGQIPPATTNNQLVASIDFLPTIAHLAGAQVPTDRIIDGKNITHLILDQPGAATPHEAYFYYFRNSLVAVRSGKYKLHFNQGFHYQNDEPHQELYDLDADIGETTDILDQHPDIVTKLNALADTIRQDIGDTATHITGQNNRPQGTTDNPRFLTNYNPDHPYIQAYYDLEERG